MYFLGFDAKGRPALHVCTEDVAGGDGYNAEAL
jgi:hypothetical protein